ncbi:MAG TPA: hypothetical protein VFY18_01180 [Candidatus Limnocylindrales bacterium]|nr:hypothetical protein [Candidatus Limnocylindrales bacterium]
MGPLLLTGLALFGAILGIGLVAQSAAVPEAAIDQVSPARRLAVILIAFAAGCGVLGVVEGLLAITQGAIAGSASAAIPLVSAIAGAVLGLMPVVRNAGRLDPWVTSKAVAFAGGLVALAVVVGFLAAMIQAVPRGSPSDWPFTLLGVVSAAGTIGIGAVGGRWVRRVVAVDDEVAVTLVRTAITRILPFEVAGYVASLIGIALVVTA